MRDNVWGRVGAWSWHLFRCGSWWCKSCSRRRQRDWGRRIRAMFHGHHSMMVTLTVDRERFASPAAAVQFVRRNRPISRMVTEFYSRFGRVNDRLWACRLEVHKDGWPHWHVLLLKPLGVRLFGLFDELWRYGWSNVRFNVPVSYFLKYVAGPVEADTLASVGRVVTSCRRLGERSEDDERRLSDSEERVRRERPLSFKLSHCGCSLRVSRGAIETFIPASCGERPGFTEDDAQEWCLDDV